MNCDSPLTSGAKLVSRIAVFHDNFAQMGDAEKVAEEIYNLLSGAALHSTLTVPELLTDGLRKANIQTTWMQHLPGIKDYFRHYSLLYPLAVEGVDLTNYDLVVSSCLGYAKGIRKRKDAVHVCYCHSPMSWVWRYDDNSVRAGLEVEQSLLPGMLARLKRWDLRSAKRPDYFIANSQVVAERIKQIYHREAIVIPPPIDVDRFQSDEPQEDFYLVLSPLVHYKRVDIAIEACNRLNRRLVIVGDGPDRKRLARLAGPSITFAGRQLDEVVTRYAGRCRALIVPGEEDSGMRPLEVNAAGRPVLAFRAGGVLETVVEGATGLFFDQPTANSLAAAIEDLEGRSWHRTALRRHARNFDRPVFAKKFLNFLNEVAPSLELRTLALQHSMPSLEIQAMGATAARGVR